MARYAFQDTARDLNGRAIPTATITVYLTGTTTAATIYSTGTTLTSISGSSFSANTNGTFKFWVDDGDYALTQKFRIRISKDGFATTDYDDIMLYPLSNLSYTATTTSISTSTSYIDNGTDRIVYVDTSGGSVTVTAPVASTMTNGQKWTIVHVTAGNTLTFTDGTTTFTSTLAGECFTLSRRGTVWQKIGS